MFITAPSLKKKLLMTPTIDYYFTPQSPWTYLGHARFSEMARQAGATVRVLPADLGQVFAVSGGLPLGKRAPQRQAYRLVELKRFSDSLQLPLHVKPAFFPVAGDDASRLIIAVDQQDGTAAAMRLSGAVFSAVWTQERNIADAAVLAQLLDEQGLSADRLAQSRSPEVQQRYEANTQQAIDAAVFGAPSYVVDGEMFWGQDRLEFVAQKLAAK
ncbi:MAG: 2-hydroxychromene-2-carboxylate isomerase [Litorivivens sp.]|jgi:2-hydroxychromene-2-carboxylate isomerase